MQQTGVSAIAVVTTVGCLHPETPAAPTNSRGNSDSATRTGIQLSWQCAMPFALPIGCPGTRAAIHPEFDACNQKGRLS